MKVMVLGGTGLIGRRLAAALVKRGDEVVVVSRRAAEAKALLGPKVEVLAGDPTQKGDWTAALSQCQGVVNLAGTGIFDRRWNDEFKAVLRDSRVKTTQHLVDGLKAATPRPGVLVNGSAIGYYGFSDDTELTEESPAGKGDFLSRLASEWEAAAQPAAGAGVRTVLLRTGVVLDRAGGALPQILKPYKMSLTLVAGGAIGSGKQWVSWIHHADEVGLILFALDRAEVSGPLNATAPQPVTNRELAKAVGRAVHRLAFPPTPAFALRLGLGEVADLVTKGQRVVPKKALALGYQFQFPTIDAALADIMASPATIPAA
jgi:uncharacterized protein (TIGR01777 family)